jgi:undecaprenyl-diphosphatase
MRPRCDHVFSTHAAQQRSGRVRIAPQPPSPQKFARTSPGPHAPAWPTAGVVIGVAWVALLLVGYAAGRIVTDAHPSWDASVVAEFRGTNHGTLTDAMRTLSVFGSTAVLDAVFALATIILLMWRYWRGVLFLLLASPGTVLLVQILKQAVNRARPAVHHLAAADGPSWPSGHASGSLALYGGLLIIGFSIYGRASDRARRVRVAAVCLTVALAALIGVSRVYLAVHYPTDVLCSWVLVGVWLWVLTRTVSLPASGQRLGHAPSTSGSLPLIAPTRLGPRWVSGLGAAAVFLAEGVAVLGEGVLGCDLLAWAASGVVELVSPCDEGAECLDVR